jgi:hypothetical protein
MSVFLNFLTEISIIEGNPQTLPQIDDVEAESYLNVTAIICPNNLRCQCRLGTCLVYLLQAMLVLQRNQR